jgi:DNA-binding beta-propeller fold protein YncE
LINKFVVPVRSDGSLGDRFMTTRMRISCVAALVLAVTLGQRIGAQEIATFKVGVDVNGIAFAPDGKSVAVCGGRGWTVVNVANTQQAYGVTLRINFAHAVVFSPDGKDLLVGTTMAVDVWAVPSKEVKEAIPCAETAYALAFALDAKTLAGGERASIKLWDFDKRKELKTLKIDLAELGKSGERGNYSSVSISADGKRIAGAEWRGNVDVFDAEGKLYLTFRRGVFSSAVAFSPDGKMLASADDSTIKITDLATKKPVAELKGHKSGVLALAYTPSGMLISGSEDGTVRFWNVNKKKELVTLSGHGRVRRLALTKDGAILASGDDAGVVKLWDVAKALK